MPQIWGYVGINIIVYNIGATQTFIEDALARSHMIKNELHR